VRELGIEGRSRGNNRRKEGEKVLAYCHRAIRAGRSCSCHQRNCRRRHDNDCGCSLGINVVDSVISLVSYKITRKCMLYTEKPLPPYLDFTQTQRL
jgi:hypothetical protein